MVQKWKACFDRLQIIVVTGQILVLQQQHDANQSKSRKSKQPLVMRKWPRSCEVDVSLSSGRKGFPIPQSGLDSTHPRSQNVFRDGSVFVRKLRSVEATQFQDCA